jgi:hypothetical protein
MAFWNHKRARAAKPAQTRIAELFAAPHQLGQPGWWRDDHTEQLRNYQS